MHYSVAPVNEAGRARVAARVDNERPVDGGQCVRQLPQQLLAGLGGLDLPSLVVGCEQRRQSPPLLVAQVPGAAQQQPPVGPAVGAGPTAVAVDLLSDALPDNARWSNTYGSRTSCCASSESGAGSAAAKFDGADPARSSRRVSTWPWASTSRTSRTRPRPRRTSPPPAGVELVEQHHQVAPGQACSRLLHKLLRPRLGQRPHVVQVAQRPAALVRELGPQVGSEPVDDPAAPAGLSCRSRMSRPTDQYNPSSSLVAARAARTRDARTRALSCSSSSA